MPGWAGLCTAAASGNTSGSDWKFRSGEPGGEPDRRRWRTGLPAVGLLGFCNDAWLVSAEAASGSDGLGAFDVFACGECPFTDSGGAGDAGLNWGESGPGLRMERNAADWEILASGVCGTCLDSDADNSVDTGWRAGEPSAGEMEISTPDRKGTVGGDGAVAGGLDGAGDAGARALTPKAVTREVLQVSVGVRVSSVESGPVVECDAGSGAGLGAGPGAGAGSSSGSTKRSDSLRLTGVDELPVAESPLTPPAGGGTGVWAGGGTGSCEGEDGSETAGDTALSRNGRFIGPPGCQSQFLAQRVQETEQKVEQEQREMPERDRNPWKIDDERKVTVLLPDMGVKDGVLRRRARLANARSRVARRRAESRTGAGDEMLRASSSAVRATVWRGGIIEALAIERDVLPHLPRLGGIRSSSFVIGCPDARQEIIVSALLTTDFI